MGIGVQKTFPKIDSFVSLLLLSLLRVALTAAVAAAIVLFSLLLRVGFADEYSYLFAISPLAATGRVLLSY